MTPWDALRALTDTLVARTDLSELEARRLTRDLERVALRLRNGDYEKSGFEDNVLNLPDRVQQTTVEVEFMAAVGRSWARLLGPLVASAQRAIDLGPGWAPKVELGLLYGGFTGHVVLVNQDAAALTTLQRFMTAFPLAFTLDAVDADLFTWPGEPADLVLANHLLDDVVLDLYCKREGVDAGTLYERESAFQAAWERILAWPASDTDTLVARLADAVARLTRPGGHAVFAQYPSYAERTLSLDGAIAHGQRVLRGLGAELVARGFADVSAERGVALASDPWPVAPEHCLVVRRLTAAARPGASSGAT